MPKKRSAGMRTSVKRGHRASETERFLEGAFSINYGAKKGGKRSYAQKPVDPDDAPELTKEYFERADLYHGGKLIRRGRPPSDNPKQALKLRIDPDVVEHYRATGPGWQTRINDALRRAAKLPMRK